MPPLPSYSRKRLGANWRRYIRSDQEYGSRSCFQCPQIHFLFTRPG
ncbi:hypothetical protein F441_16484 [Phytophthora nicotianae CJ01A1]|uniref:Uncharacterized protein n=1 Tax=Phytophthora nicotianae CJ01A1 TaxID=1317063 RepID=W2W9I0_PHYNI|nr:hypothetical protein F441_16484 [Phytophthora nicotianae CJ01A1]